MIKFFNFLKTVVNSTTIFIFKSHIFGILTFKLIVLLCTFIYIVFFLILTFFSFKAYQLAVTQLAAEHAFHSHLDLVKLLNNFPLKEGQWVPITNESLKLLLDTNNIAHYSNLIYPVNNEVNALHQIIVNNPDTSSRFSSMVIQQLVENNSREFAELAEQLVKRLFKYSLPLRGLVLTMVGIHLLEPTLLLA